MVSDSAAVMGSLMQARGFAPSGQLQKIHSPATGLALVALDYGGDPWPIPTLSATFDKTGLIVRGGVAAPYEAAANRATVVPPDYRLIQFTEIGQTEEGDAVKVAFAAVIEEV
jgi:hypothetical protein